MIDQRKLCRKKPPARFHMRPAAQDRKWPIPTAFLMLVQAFSASCPSIGDPRHCPAILARKHARRTPRGFFSGSVDPLETMGGFSNHAPWLFARFRQLPECAWRACRPGAATAMRQRGRASCEYQPMWVRPAGAATRPFHFRSRFLRSCLHGTRPIAQTWPTSYAHLHANSGWIWKSECLLALV